MQEAENCFLVRGLFEAGRWLPSCSALNQWRKILFLSLLCSSPLPLLHCNLPLGFPFFNLISEPYQSSRLSPQSLISKYFPLRVRTSTYAFGGDRTQSIMWICTLNEQSRYTAMSKLDKSPCLHLFNHSKVNQRLQTQQCPPITQHLFITCG